VGETRSSSSIIIITAVIRSCTCCTQRSPQLATRPYRHHPQRRIPSSTYPTYPSRHRTRLLKTLPSRRKRTPSLALPAMSNSSEDPDVWIAQLMNCKPLSEGEVKKLCDKVSRGDVPVVLYQATCKKKERYKREPQKGDGCCDDPNTQRKGRGFGQKGETSMQDEHLNTALQLAFRDTSALKCLHRISSWFGYTLRPTSRAYETAYANNPDLSRCTPHHTSSISIDRRFESSSLKGNISEASHISRCSSLLRDPGNRLGG
jgi:hypothetical protein